MSTRGKVEVEVSALQLPGFTIFAIIRIALHLKLHLAHFILPFLCALPEQERSILYSQIASL